MNNENEVMEKAPVLTKKDCVKGAIRWSLMAVTTFNYDTQLAPAVVFGIGPLLRKIYKDDDEYVEALNNHYKYFNTMPWLANIVLGATLALEDKEGITSLDAVQNIKVSLMGPLAGIGDTLFWTLLPTIMGSIAGYMALEGNPKTIRRSVMRRYIIASHHLLAHGLKDTLNFLTSMDGIIDISAYMDDTDLPTQIKELFDSFDPEDEVVMMTDMLGGSVNQQFCPYVNDHRHLICGINLPCALSLVLQPQDMPLTAETIRTIVEESRSHLIYVNEYNDGANEDDE